MPCLAQVADECRSEGRHAVLSIVVTWIEPGIQHEHENCCKRQIAGPRLR
jgi:hypothetical protein